MRSVSVSQINQNAPAWFDPAQRQYSRKYRKRAVARFIESRKPGSLGCALILNAIEEFEPGWVEKNENDGLVSPKNWRSVFRLDLSALTGPITISYCFSPKVSGHDPWDKIPREPTHLTYPDLQTNHSLG